MSDAETNDTIFLTGSLIAAAVAPWTLFVTGPIAFFGMMGRRADREALEAQFVADYEKCLAASREFTDTDEEAHEWALNTLRRCGYDV